MNEKYEALKRNIDMLGVEQMVTPIELAEDQKIRIKGKDGIGIEASGEGCLFVAYLPPEAYEDE